MTGLDLLKQQFNGHVAFRERRPGVLQVLAPLFHEDGDMVDIFLVQSPPDPQNCPGGATRVLTSSTTRPALSCATIASLSSGSRGASK